MGGLEIGLLGFRVPEIGAGPRPLKRAEFRVLGLRLLSTSALNPESPNTPRDSKPCKMSPEEKIRVYLDPKEPTLLRTTIRKS